MPIGLLALALGGFGIGLTEFGIVGLLPEISADLGVSESTAGLLVSGYALSVAVGAIALTAALSRVDRKKSLVMLMILFILGNLISAIAPSYPVLMAGRLVAALCHGAFFGVGAVVAAEMVAPNRRASAIALMFGGLTVATVIGVPLGAFLGQQTGWRSIFWALVVIGIVTMISVQILVKVTARPERTSLRAELRIYRRPQVWISTLLSVLTFGGVVGAFTYIAFVLTEVSGFSAASVPWLLVLFGVGTFIGNLVGGKLADRSLAASLTGILAVLTVVLVAFAITAQSQVAAIVSLFLLGAVGLATAPGLQIRIMRYAEDAPTLASGTNIAALNVGNAIGAWVGGLALAAGFGFASPLWTGAALAAAALVTVLVGTALPSSRTSVVAREEATAPA